MWDRIKQLFCCSEAQNVVTPILSNRRRVNSMYKQEEVTVVADEVRRAGELQCFSCPICFLYFTSNFQCYSEIMSCSQCHNFICCNCLNQLVEKADRQSTQMRCCFCLSESCRFEDWKEAEQKQYFDMTSKDPFKNQPLAVENSSIQIVEPPHTLAQQPPPSQRLPSWADRVDPALLHTV